MLPAALPLKRWLRMCSKMAAKLMNSSDESSMGSAVYFSRRVLTENLKQKQTGRETFQTCFCARARVSIQRGCAPTPPHTNVRLYLNPATIAGRRVLFFWDPCQRFTLRSPQLSCVQHKAPLQRASCVIMKSIQLTPCPPASLWSSSLRGTVQHQRMIKSPPPPLLYMVA